LFSLWVGRLSTSAGKTFPTLLNLTSGTSDNATCEYSVS